MLELSYFFASLFYRCAKRHESHRVASMHSYGPFDGLNVVIDDTNRSKIPGELGALEGFPSVYSARAIFRLAAATLSNV